MELDVFYDSGAYLPLTCRYFMALAVHTPALLYRLLSLTARRACRAVDIRAKPSDCIANVPLVFLHADSQ